MLRIPSVPETIWERQHWAELASENGAP